MEMLLVGIVACIVTLAVLNFILFAVNLLLRAVIALRERRCVVRPEQVIELRGWNVVFDGRYLVTHLESTHMGMVLHMFMCDRNITKKN